MSQERGRHLKDKLEQISNEYSALHTIFKKMTTYEEELSALNVNFAKKWNEITPGEENPKLCVGISAFTSALAESEENRKISLDYIKDHIQGSLKMYPVKIKKQKRSLSRNSRSAREAEDRQNEVIDEKMRNFEDTHVNDMKQLMLHLVNAEMFYHSKSLEMISRSYKTMSIDISSE